MYGSFIGGKDLEAAAAILMAASSYDLANIGHMIRTGAIEKRWKSSRRIRPTARTCRNCRASGKKT